MARDNSKFGIWIAGSEFINYRIRLVILSVCHMLIVGCVVGAITFIATPFILFDEAERDLLNYNRWGDLFSSLKIGRHPWLALPVTIGNKDYGRLKPDDMVSLTDDLIDDADADLLNRLRHYHALSLFALFAGAYLWWMYTRKTGRWLQGDTFLRGQTLVGNAELKGLIERSRAGISFYSICGIPVPNRAQMQNFAFFGSMGSGKSQGIMPLADQVARAGKKMVIYDKTGEFLQAFYRPGIDLILNPLDSRSVQWNLFSEIRDIFDPDMLAAALIPTPVSNNATAEYFITGARVVFSQSLQKLWAENRRTTSALCDVLLTYGPTEFSLWLDKTEAASYISDKALEQAMGIISTLTGQIRALKFTGDGSFSIRDFLSRRDEDVRLFVTSGATVHDVLRPLISMYMDVAIRAAMSGEKSASDDWLWIFLDELGSLHRLPALAMGLTEARKYGVCHVVGLQNASQLREAFGEEQSLTLRSNLQNTVVFRVHDGESEETYSKYLGSSEIDETSSNMTYGVSDMKEGQGLQTSRNELPLVTASQLQTLPDQTGYLKVAGEYPITRITYSYRNWSNPSIAAFMARPDITMLAPVEDEIVIDVPVEEGAALSQSDAPVTDPLQSVVEVQSSPELRKKLFTDVTK